MQFEPCSVDIFDLLHCAAPIDLKNGEISTAIYAEMDKIQNQKTVTSRHNQTQLEVGDNLSRKVPQLLVCHDMRGNYLNDSNNRGDVFGNAFQITDWSIIDIFCYFSHHLISIPPVQWISCCHRHNTKVLGTFLTEWEGGHNICKKLFSSIESATLLADLLVRLACIYDIDGWLINIENALDYIIQVPIVVQFLRILTNKMHDLNPSSKILWYDAVTVEGLLRWQNKLNHLNYTFFDQCDGIFINYQWSEDTPPVSVLYGGMQRRYDIYFGVDCWGRGTYGGGRYNCDRALQVLRQYGVSAALFAPGFILEDEICRSLKCSSAQQEIIRRYIHFWSTIRAVWPQSKPLQTLPICINFTQGAGQGVFVRGHCFDHWFKLTPEKSSAIITDPQITNGDDLDNLEDNDWFYDLSLQNINWNMSILTCLESNIIHRELCYDVAYDGTCSLHLWGEIVQGDATEDIALTQVTWGATTQNQIVVIEIVLVATVELLSKLGVFVRTELVHRSFHFELVSSSEQWETRKYRVKVDTTGRKSACIGVSCGPSSFNCLIGLFAASIAEQPAFLATQILFASNPVQNAFISDDNRFSLTLKWDYAIKSKYTMVDIFAINDENIVKDIVQQGIQPSELLPTAHERTVGEEAHFESNLLYGYMLEVFTFSSKVAIENASLTLLGRTSSNYCQFQLPSDSHLILTPAFTEHTEGVVLSSFITFGSSESDTFVSVDENNCGMSLCTQYKFMLFLLVPNSGAVPSKDTVYNFILVLMKK